MALARSCAVTVNSNRGHDKQEWEDSCRVCADTRPHLNNNAHGSIYSHWVMYIKMGLSFDGQQQEVVWLKTAAIMGKVCVQFYIHMKNRQHRLYVKHGGQTSEIRGMWHADLSLSIRLSSTRTETLEAVTMSAWVTVPTCTPCLIAAAPSGWRVACSWSTTVPASWETNTSWRGGTTLTT